MADPKPTIPRRSPSATAWLALTNAFVIVTIACIAWQFAAADRAAIATDRREIAGIRDISEATSPVAESRAISGARVARDLEERFDRIERSSLGIADRSGLSFDTDSDERDLADAYGRDGLRTADLLTILARVAAPAGAPSSHTDPDLARLEVETLAASGSTTLDVSQASKNSSYELAELLTEAERAQSAVEYVSAYDGAGLGDASVGIDLHDFSRRLDTVERRLHVDIGRRLEQMLSADERNSVNHRYLVWLAAGAGIAISFLLFNAIGAANRSAGALERLEAERERERAVSVVQNDLLEADRLFRATVDHAPIGILILDSTSSVVTANDEVARIVGDVSSFIHAESANVRSVVDSGDLLEHGVALGRSDGTVARVDVAYRPFVFGTSKEPYVISILRDVSERHELTEMLEHEASHDALTSLPNRRAFEAMLRKAAEEGDVALLYIDLDDFKRINDGYGHHAGDHVLAVAAERLLGLARSGDLIGRFGGDEFAIATRAPDREDARMLAERVVAELSRPIPYEGVRLEISASVGVVSPFDSAPSPVDERLRDADEAMYQAKKSGGNRAVTFTAAMRERARRKIELAEDLKAALHTDQLGLEYQAIFDLRAREVVGFEALARWKHPRLGVVSPLEFVPVAESIGLIEELGGCVLREACRQLAEWRAAGPLASRVNVNVNVAPRQILTGSIERQLRDALHASSLRGKDVTLEITESSLLDDASRTMETLGALRRMGSLVYIDDFGTGYSSLSYLQRYPIDGIKVDRSFVSADGHASLASRPIVEMLSTLSRVLGIGLVVEGIETIEQCRELEELDCERGQGYLLARPLPPHLVLPMLDLARRSVA